jgi:hypothetical protein
MSAFDIYKAALESLAEKGNEEAKVALSLASRVPSTDVHALAREVCSKVQDANDSLVSALSENASGWRKSTDRYIESARRKLQDTIILLAVK